MTWAQNLTRDELIGHLAVCRDDPEFIQTRDAYLKSAVLSKDVQLVDLLLKAGANPNHAESWGDTLLHYLVHEYEVTRTTQGAVVLQLADLLLSHGADPELVGGGNWRAIDLCIEHRLNELVSLFVRYGADPKQRAYV